MHIHKIISSLYEFLKSIKNLIDKKLGDVFFEYEKNSFEYKKCVKDEKKIEKIKLINNKYLKSLIIYFVH